MIGPQTTPVGVTLLAALALSACGGDGSGTMGPEHDEEEAFLSIASGNDQLGKPGEPLSNEIVVQLVDGSGEPVLRSGTEIRWSVTYGGGSVSGAATTDESGRAAATWILGPEEGIQSARADAGSAGSTPLLARSLEHPRPVVFSSNRLRTGFGSKSDLFMMEADGSEMVRLTATPGREEYPAWSPDGTRLAFVRGFSSTCADEQGDVVVIDFTTYTETRITEADDPCSVVVGLSWAPDGERLVLARDFDIRIIGTDGATMARPVSTFDGVERGPDWSPGGEWIAFDRTTPPNSNNNRPIFVVRPDGSEERALTDEGSDDGFARWSPDGTRIAFHRRPFRGADPETWRVLVMNADGSGASPLPVQGAWSSTWSPDGTELLLSVISTSAVGCTTWVAHLVRYDLDTGETTEITDGCAKDLLAAWRPR